MAVTIKIRRNEQKRYFEAEILNGQPARILPGLTIAELVTKVNRLKLGDATVVGDIDNQYGGLRNGELVSFTRLYNGGNAK